MSLRRVLLSTVRFSSTRVPTYKYGGRLIQNDNPVAKGNRVELKVKLENLTIKKLHVKNIFNVGYIASFLTKIHYFYKHIRKGTMAGVHLDMTKCDLSPPEDVKGMKILDRSAFEKITYVPGLTVPMPFINDFSKIFKDIFLKIPGIKPWTELAKDDPLLSTHKLVLLNPDKFSGLESLNEDQRDTLARRNICNDSVRLYSLNLSYKNWTYNEILSAILPDESDGIAGFSSIGHILHLNLREEVLDYKNIIGDVLLDKVSSARSVVNKLNTIDNTYRNFEMEVLAGDNNMVTVAKEHGLEYHLDFSKVYWNPRLGTEHRRIVNCLGKHDILYDVFAGIGPFSVPAAKKGCTVLANDLNPESYRWLQHNLKCNKVRGNYVTHNLDGREFIRTVIREDLVKQWSTEHQHSPSYHIAMNLPAMAIEFLDAFRGLFDAKSDWPSFRLPHLYCYGFSKAEDTQADIRNRVEHVLGTTLDKDNSEMRFVRNVAPGKDMICATFTLPYQVLFVQSESDEVLPPVKRAKTESTTDSASIETS